MNEESIRKNFILIYELLDEMVVCVRCANTAASSPRVPRTPHSWPVNRVRGVCIGAHLSASCRTTATPRLRPQRH
ncbi:hypothetical protein EON67_06635 [archaeon]|nr:MAG: hypothetical protein EON67_06635 [archaeon]